MKLPPKRGFTLIELLVVIAIIGILSAVVLASLATARIKARNASVQQEMNHFATVLELEYDDKKSYNALKTGWVYTAADCAAKFAGSNYTANAQAICTNIVANSRGFQTAEASSNAGKYSIVVYLKDATIYYCRGSNGASSWNSTSSNSTSPGCYSDPNL